MSENENSGIAYERFDDIPTTSEDLHKKTDVKETDEARPNQIPRSLGEVNTLKLNTNQWVFLCIITYLSIGNVTVKVYLNLGFGMWSKTIKPRWE